MYENQLYERIYNLKEELTSAVSEYWQLYSGPHTWYFWLNVVMFSIPLIFLFYKIDKRRLFEICFFGYSIHVIWVKVDSVLYQHNLLIHPHPFTPFLAGGMHITVILFPITLMLVYQYCTNKGKNFYIYSIIASAIFAYPLGWLSLKIDLFNLHKGMTLTYIFLIDLVIVFVSYWFTKFLLGVKRKYL